MNEPDDAPRTPADYFNHAVESFDRGMLTDAVAFLRSGFFENIYIAPILLRETVQRQTVWHAGLHAEPGAAREYVSRYQGLWDESPRGVSFLRIVWNDPLVRNELKSYINLCKSLKHGLGERQREDLLRERRRFASPDRIIRTQAEILRRIAQTDLDVPVRRPFLGLIMLSAHDTAASVEFFRKLFGLDPIRTRNIPGGYCEFEFEGVHLAIHGYNQHGDGDPYHLGPPPQSLGWGAFFVIRVLNFDRYHDNALDQGIEVIDSELDQKGSRFFVVKDPSGYVLEITEEELHGFAVG